MATALADLVERGIIRILDLLIIQKDADGSIEALEIDDLDAVDEIVHLEAEIAEILAADDVEHLAAAMEPGTVAGVLVWENLWAAPFGAAARKAGGQVVASWPHPDPGHHRVARSRRGLTHHPPRLLSKGTTMPLRPARAARRGVVGAPVARTAAVVGTAAVVAHGVDRRQDRREDRRDRR